MKHEWIGTGFISQNMTFLVMEEKLQRDLHQTTLHNGYLHNLKVLQEKVLER